MHLISLVTFLNLFAFYFQSTPIDKTVPSCIKKEIRKFEKSAACPDSHVDKYTFRKSVVYVFEPGTCGADMQSDVFNTKGKKIGALGGITGNTKINNVDFSTAVLIKTVWKKTP
jgi:hypothetical protein